MIQSLLRKSVSLVPWRLRGAVKRLPLVAPLQRWMLARFLEGREFVHTVDAGPATGLKYPVTLPDDKGIWTGTYELDLATRIAQAVRSGDVCLDVGGWRGFFSGVMALAGASKVLVFEPLPANAAQIRRMLTLNPKLPVELIEAAVSDEAGEVEFCILPESSMGKLAGSSFQQTERGSARIRVRTVTLDQWFGASNTAPPAVIKIDVEGAELDVLRGGRSVLERYHPHLFIEIHSHELGRECHQFLSSLGYTVLVLETQTTPDEALQPEVCHFAATLSPNKGIPSAGLPQVLS